MILTDEIARFIENMLAEAGGCIEICRNDLAGKIGCVPSQINYVITSRFTPDRGYVIESRRGGGGYIRIIKKQFHKNEYLMHFIQAVGNEISAENAAVFIGNLEGHGVVTPREAAIIAAAASSVDTNAKRAALLKNIAVTLIS
jgi:transcriptional regulator CtsR